MAEPIPAIAIPVEPESRYLRNPAEITTCLKQLRDQRAEITIRVDGVAESFNCKLLDVSDRDFLIEDIKPRSGSMLIRDAKRISLSSRGTGSYMLIEDARIDKCDSERGVPYFHIALPKQMLFQQRRRSARFRLPLKVSASGASITMFGEQTFNGRIIDISAGGCRAEFELPAPWEVKVDDRFANCAITIPPMLEIHTEAVIRHFHENKHSKTLVCGIELIKMHVTDRRRLEYFIQTITKSADTARHTTTQRPSRMH